MTPKNGCLDSTALRLSCVRAFIGRIHPNVRLIKVGNKGSKIAVTLILDASPKQEQVEIIQDASTEVIADFPDCTITEKIEVGHEAIPSENIIEHGWIYRRFE